MAQSQHDLLSLAAITAEQEMRERVVNALAAAAESLDDQGEHGMLCPCQRAALFAAMEAACSGLAVNVFANTLSRAQERQAGTLMVSTEEAFGLPSLAEFVLGKAFETEHEHDSGFHPESLNAHLLEEEEGDTYEHLGGAA